MKLILSILWCFSLLSLCLSWDRLYTIHSSPSVTRDTPLEEAVSQDPGQNHEDLPQESHTHLVGSSFAVWSTYLFDSIIKSIVTRCTSFPSSRILSMMSASVAYLLSSWASLQLREHWESLGVRFSHSKD